MLRAGQCTYCGQTRMLEVEENVTKEGLNELATEECECIQAEVARKRAKTQAEAVRLSNGTVKVERSETNKTVMES